MDAFILKPIIYIYIYENKTYKILAEQIPLGEILSTEDVTYGIIYLASDESRMMTGSELVIDGGLTSGYMPPI